MSKAAETTTALPERPSLQEAFAAAKVQHAGADDGTGDVVDDDAGDDDTDEFDDAETTDTQVDETPKQAAKDTEDTKDDENSLLTDDEFTALQTKHKDDPAALRKELLGVFTKKTQALAERRKSTERLESYRDVVEAYDADPEGTLIALAKQHGLTITAPGETSTKTSDSTSTTDPTPQPKPIDFDYDMDKWSEAHAKWSNGEIDRRVEAAVQPLKVGQQTILEKHAVEATETVLKTLTEQHPDWKAHEPAMLVLSQKLAPAAGMSENEYLDHIYKLVTFETPEARKKAIDVEAAKVSKAALDKMAKGATSTDSKTRRVSDDQVTTGPPNDRMPDLRESYAAAKRGERWV